MNPLDLNPPPVKPPSVNQPSVDQPSVDQLIVKNNKQYLREHCLLRRKKLSEAQRQIFSKTIFNTLRNYLHRHYADGAQILCYRSLRCEVDTTAVFQMPCKYQCFAPVTTNNTNMHWLRCDADTLWKTASLNVLEPTGGQCWQASVMPSIVLCPVVGFDATGNRLGMGKGYFDRWLAQNRQHFDMIIGLAFACQQCPEIAYETHDIPLDAIINEEGWMQCPNT